jgi:hypothetical protein
VIREHFKPKISELLKSEIEIRESQERTRAEKIRAIRENTSRNQDYLREMASKRRSEIKVDESVTSLSNA